MSTDLTTFGLYFTTSVKILPYRTPARLIRRKSKNLDPLLIHEINFVRPDDNVRTYILVRQMYHCKYVSFLRVVKINLKCDESKFPREMSGVINDYMLQYATYVSMLVCPRFSFVIKKSSLTPDNDLPTVCQFISVLSY